MKGKKVVAIIATIAVVLCMPIVNLAHSGRTDSSGGHKDNKNASGLGSYHYHCGGHPAHLHDGGICPYSSPAPSSSSKSTSTTSTKTTTTTPSTVNVTKVELSEKAVQLLIGETKSLTATVFPSNATDKTITWTSSDKKVVMVDSEGELVALAPGEAEVTVKSSNGKAAILKVTVNPIKVSEIKLSEKEINLKVEEKASLIAEVLPDNATDKTIEWTSENSEIASVEDGVITAVSAGTTKVICQSKDGIKVEVNVVVEREETVGNEETIENENTVEVSAIVDDSTTENTVASTSTTSDSSGLLGVATLGAMIGVPVYFHKKKKN